VDTDASPNISVVTADTDASPNLSVVTVDTDRDPHTRHGLNLNAHGKEHVANKITTVINDLFSQKLLPITTLKWKEKEDMATYLIENQPPCVKEIYLSGRSLMKRMTLRTISTVMGSL
jgi:hypothetical protein